MRKKAEPVHCSLDAAGGRTATGRGVGNLLELEADVDLQKTDKC